METKTIVQYVVAGVIVVGSLFVAYNAQDKITGQASEIKALQNQVAVLTDEAAQNDELINLNKALQTEVKNLDEKAMYFSSGDQHGSHPSFDSPIEIDFGSDNPSCAPIIKEYPFPPLSENQAS